MKNYRASLIGLFLAMFAGGLLYVFFPSLTLLRLALPFLVFFAGKIMLSNTHWTFMFNNSLMLLLFYAFYFFSTFFNSFFMFNFDSYEAANFFVLFVLQILLFIYLSANRVKFLSILFKFSILTLFIFDLIALWEITTHKHLPSSGLVNGLGLPPWLTTAFYFNPNDFCAVSSMAILYCSLFLRYFRLDRQSKLYSNLCLVMYLFSVFVSVWNNSRINFYFLIGWGAIYLFGSKRNVKLWTCLGSIFILSIVFLHYYEMPFKELVFAQNLSVNHGNSVHTRFNLYVEAIKGMTLWGYGVGQSQDFYKNLPSYTKARLNNAIDPHNYLLEILINSGIINLLLLCFILAFFTCMSFVFRRYLVGMAIIFYPFILLSSSSSIFLWPHYIYLYAITAMVSGTKLYEERFLTYYENFFARKPKFSSH